MKELLVCYRIGNNYHFSCQSPSVLQLPRHREEDHQRREHCLLSAEPSGCHWPQWSWKVHHDQDPDWRVGAPRRDGVEAP